MDPIDTLLTRGVANIIPSKENLERVLRSPKKINIYCGFDVTAPHLHIGNAVSMRKLQQFADLGHHVTFLIGDFTTLVGDTSDKDTERPVISEDDIAKNWQSFESQASKILDLSKITVRRNSEWLDSLTSRDVIKLMRKFSLNDFLSRELIKNRLTKGNSVNLAEVLYPALQGYDSYFMDMDLQIGATDQTFNMQAGRTLQKQLRDKDTFVMSFEFLEGLDGRKMSKSWGNAIWLDDEPNDMFGKVMSLKDELIPRYFELATNIDNPNIADPMQSKKQLAWQIVSELHSKELAELAKSHFESVHQQGRTPTDIPEFKISSSNIIDVLVETGLATSKSDARRLIDQGGVKINETKISDFDIRISNLDIIQAGPRTFARITSTISSLTSDNHH